MKGLFNSQKYLGPQVENHCFKGVGLIDFGVNRVVEAGPEGPVLADY